MEKNFSKIGITAKSKGFLLYFTPSQTYSQFFLLGTTIQECLRFWFFLVAASTVLPCRRNHHRGITSTHLEPDILECEVRWALGNTITNKASGGHGIPVELLQILKAHAVKCCTQYASKFGKLSSGHRTGKGQFSFQSQTKAMPKNVQLHDCIHFTS